MYYWCIELLSRIRLPREWRKMHSALQLFALARRIAATQYKWSSTLRNVLQYISFEFIFQGAHLFHQEIRLYALFYFTGRHFHCQSTCVHFFSKFEDTERPHACSCLQLVNEVTHALRSARSIGVCERSTHTHIYIHRESGEIMSLLMWITNTE